MGAVIPLRRGRGRKPTQDGRQCFLLLPMHAAAPGRRLGFLYAVGYLDGRVKIGRSANPRRRVFSHWTTAEGRIAWAHVFAPIDHHLLAGAEYSALCEAAKVGNRIGNTEMFTGLTRADALACVREAIAWRLSWDKRVERTEFALRGAA